MALTSGASGTRRQSPASWLTGVESAPLWENLDKSPTPGNYRSKFNALIEPIPEPVEAEDRPVRLRRRIDAPDDEQRLAADVFEGHVVPHPGVGRVVPVVAD